MSDVVLPASQWSEKTNPELVPCSQFSPQVGCVFLFLFVCF